MIYYFNFENLLFIPSNILSHFLSDLVYLISLFLIIIFLIYNCENNSAGQYIVISSD